MTARERTYTNMYDTNSAEILPNFDFCFSIANAIWSRLCHESSLLLLTAATELSIARAAEADTVSAFKSTMRSWRTFSN